ncbi:MAG: A/G-specific adenine glycosylase [Actinomycetota bacterium]|nr:A/G-specific adenine glycosylase [Actinomycetota bacterium]
MDATRLLTWFDTCARDLPWRHPDTTAWGVLVSEVMLQQTPVARVAPVWSDWMARWPRPSALAAAPQGTVLRAWGKLGYPRRALRIHAAATVIAADHGDVVPSGVDTLLALPGIGTYTARAVAAFGYGARVAVVDTNVRRVVSRAVRGVADAGPPSTARDLSAVDALLPEHDAARFSAALMELGAVLCIAGSPRCTDCPLAGGCAWHHAGYPPTAEPARPAQRFTGTDRQVRGRLLDVLREAPSPVEPPQLDVVWSDEVQRNRCLDSLLVDGLIQRCADGRFALPGEASTQPGEASTRPGEAFTLPGEASPVPGQA